MGEQHLDLFAPSSALGIGRCVAQVTDGLAGIFVHVSRDRSERRVGTGLSDRTRAAGFLAGEVALDAVVFLDPAQGHFMPFKTGEAIAVGIILEMADVIFAVRLMLAVQDGDVRRDIAFQQPRQKRAGAV